MKETLEKLVGLEVSLRTVDGSDSIVSVRKVNDDSLLVESSDYTTSLIPFTAVAAVSFK